MNPREDQPTEVPQDLDLAYRALPPAGPSAALDARVRAAVSAALDAAPGRRRSGFARVYQRWSLIPLATAATVLVAVAVGYLSLRRHPDAQTVALQSIAIEKNAPVAPTNNREPEAPAVGSSALSANSPASAVPPELPSSGSEVRAQASVSTSDFAVPAAKTKAATAVAMEIPPEAAPAAAIAAARATAPATLDAVRTLLHDGKRQEARQLLQRWQLQNPDASVPEDLRALLDQAPSH